LSHVSFIAEVASVLRAMVRKPEEKISLGRHRLKSYDTIKIILSEGDGCHFVVYLTILSRSD